MTKKQYVLEERSEKEINRDHFIAFAVISWAISIASIFFLLIEKFQMELAVKFESEVILELVSFFFSLFIIALLLLCIWILTRLLIKNHTLKELKKGGKK